MKEICFVIGVLPFKLVFSPVEEIGEGIDGQTLYNERLIKIRNDLDDITTEIIIVHELVHAVLQTQGRCFQKKFDVEEMCEFIAFNMPVIKKALNDIYLQMGKDVGEELL